MTTLALLAICSILFSVAMEHSPFSESNDQDSSFPLITLFSTMELTGPITDASSSMTSTSGSSSSSQSRPKRKRKKISPNIRRSPKPTKAEKKSDLDSFVDACCQGDLEQVASVLWSRSVDISFDDFAGMRAAIKSGRKEIVKELMNDPRMKLDGNRWFVLACGYDNREMIVLLSRYVGFRVSSPGRLSQAKAGLLLQAVNAAVEADLSQNILQLLQWDYLKTGIVLEDRLKAYEMALSITSRDIFSSRNPFLLVLARLLLEEPGSKNLKKDVARTEGLKGVYSILMCSKDESTETDDTLPTTEQNHTEMFISWFL